MSDQEQPALGSVGMKSLAEFFMRLLFSPAFTILIFQRKRVGFRQLSYLRIFGLTVGMLFLSWMSSHAFPSHGMHSSGLPLVLYALAFLGTALWQHHARWMDLMTGIRWHTKSTGVTYTMPLFESHFQERHIYRFADPAVSFMVAIAALLFSIPLGLWLLFASASVFLLEHMVWERDLEKLLNLLDNIIDAEVQRENLKYFRGNNGASNPNVSREASGGVLSTGAIMPDLIEKRRQKAALEGRPIPPIDDLPGGSSGEDAL